MTAPTPEQLRALAKHHEEAQAFEDDVPTEVRDATGPALRAAADQLEASRAWLDGQDSAEWDAVDLDGLDRILNGDSDD